uniref:Uncharacterized protein n=1 Tax=Arundo donax TaxID=35708 RepID=A0A0A9H8S1_ARUDO
MLLGMEPVRRLSPNYRCAKFTSFPNCARISPESSFVNSLTSLSMVRLVMEGGMIPVRLLLYKSSFCKNWSLPMVGGMIPVRPLDQRSSTVRLHSSATVTGMLLVSWLLEKLSAESVAREPMEGGTGPDSCLLLLMSSLVRNGRDWKLSASSHPARPAPGREISPMARPSFGQRSWILWQVMPVQLQGWTLGLQMLRAEALLLVMVDFHWSSAAA